MACCKKTTISRQSSCGSSLYRNPLIERKHGRSSSEGEWNGVSLAVRIRRNSAFVNDGDKENSVPNIRPLKTDGKENKVIENGKKDSFFRESSNGKENLLKPSSLQLCMKRQELDSNIGLKIWDNFGSDNSDSVNVWNLDHSDSEAAPVSSWSTFPNRSLLCRPLPVDLGRCTCIIVKERSPDGFDGGTLYTLYTNEGQGRQNRKLAVAHHRRCKGRSEFTISQNQRAKNVGLDDNLIGIVTANIMGSKYHIWDQGQSQNMSNRNPKLLAAVKFVPTISTWTGSHRSMKAWIPKHFSMQLKNTNQVQHINGLPTEWEMNKDKVHQLFSKVPHYNKISKQYELDFRDTGGKAGLQIKSSMKNFQLTLERNGKQTILQLGRVAKSKYEMHYRYPLTGYQAFCICLASIDSKLCCTV